MEGGRLRKSEKTQRFFQKPKNQGFLENPTVFPETQKTQGFLENPTVFPETPKNQGEGEEYIKKTFLTE